MTQSKTVSLTDINQLVVINEGLANFQTKFRIYPAANDNPQYEVAVVNQNVLDSGEDFEFRQINAATSGTVKNDDDQLQNHYLVLKSSTPTNVVVEYDTVEIEHPPAQPPSPPQTKQESGINKTYLLIGAGVVILGVAYYYFVYTKTEQPNQGSPPPPPSSQNTSKSPVRRIVLQSPASPAMSASTISSSYQSSATPPPRARAGGASFINRMREQRR